MGGAYYLFVVDEIRSPEETEALGAQMAAASPPATSSRVAGELGAGKTTFVRGACRALGVTAPVTSPTFTIGHRYDGALRSPISTSTASRALAAGVGRPRALLRRRDCVRRVARARRAPAAAGAGDR